MNTDSVDVTKSRLKLVVVLPAHNEETNIVKAVMPYQSYVREGIIRVIVVCNACTDRTYDLVKQLGFVEAINIQIGGKVNAVNKAVESMNDGHLMVQDADTVISVTGVKKILGYIETKDFSLAAPIPCYSESRSWFVRQYYKYLFVTKAFRSGMVGAGVYLIHKRHLPEIYPMPKVIADDGYVKFSLVNYQFLRLDGVSVDLTPPQNLISLIKIRTRSRLGNLQLSNILDTKSEIHRNTIAELLCGAYRERQLVSMVIYFIVNIVSLVRARARYRKNNFFWERDESARGPHVA